MAIGMLEVKSIGRSNGRTVVGAAAYRMALDLEDVRTGETHRYTRRTGVVAHGVIGWRGDTQSLVTAIELADTAKNRKLAREIVLALPSEISRAEREQLVRRYATWLHKRHGVAVLVAVHAPGRKGDQRNHHAHLLLSTRVVQADGKSLGAKTAELDDKRTSGRHIEAWRSEWGRLIGVDMRSYARRGLALTPEPKLPHQREREQWRSQHGSERAGHDGAVGRAREAGPGLPGSPGAAHQSAGVTARRATLARRSMQRVLALDHPAHGGRPAAADRVHADPRPVGVRRSEAEPAGGVQRVREPDPGPRFG